MSYQYGKAAIDATQYNPYGCWTAVSRAGSCDGSASWNCRCECGLEKILTLRRLREMSRGETKCRHVPQIIVSTPFGTRSVPLCSRCNKLPRVTRGHCLACDCALNNERYLERKKGEIRMSFPDFWTVVCRCIAAGNRTAEGQIELTNHQNYDWSRDLGHPMQPDAS